MWDIDIGFFVVFVRSTSNTNYLRLDLELLCRYEFERTLRNYRKLLNIDLIEVVSSTEVITFEDELGVGHLAHDQISSNFSINKLNSTNRHFLDGVLLKILQTCERCE